MKRIISIVLAGLLVCSVANALNPPANAEGLYELSSARLLSSASSVTGGGLFNANPTAVAINPALPSEEQRVSVNAGYTLLFSTNPENSSAIGNALQLGMLIPTKWTVIDLFLNGVFVPFQEMNLNNSLNFKAGVSKEITDKLTVGIGLNTGYYWGAGSDWCLSTNIGILYSAGNLGFVKDVKYGVSILNLGKNYSNISAIGVNPTKDVSQFPSLLTVKAGMSGLLLDISAVKLGYSVDFTLPSFMNFIADVGLECSIKDMIYISVAEKFNLNEFSNGKNDFIPSIGVSVKFRFGFEENEYFEKQGWKESELSAAVAYKQLYNTVNCISGEVDVKLGMEDNTPPVITLWDDEGDE